MSHPDFLRWTVILAATILGIGLLVYDMKTKSVVISEPTNIKLKIEAVSA